MLATFNRCELAPDIYNNDRNSGLYLVYPEALSVRSLRGLGLPSVRRFPLDARVRQSDQSRLWATRAAARRFSSPARRTAVAHRAEQLRGRQRRVLPIRAPGETLADLIRSLSYWFGPQLREYLGKEHLLPFDQHSLKALVAPRCLLSTEAFGDLWANPTGTYQTYRAAREVYRFLGAEERIGIWYREGPHQHGLEDWKAFLDFADWHLRGKAPYPSIPSLSPILPGLPWSAPERAS